jgi:hypothetical protein
LLLVCIFVAVGCGPLFTSGPYQHGHVIHVSQAATGAGNGSSCANARSAAWFNTPSHWGSGTGRISPGTTVDLCGLITTSLTVNGNGTREHPITISFEKNAVISEPYCPGRGQGCFNTNGHSHVTLDGGPNGKIQSTANGTTLESQHPDVVGVWAVNCTGCTIKNLTIADMYVHVFDAKHQNDVAARTDDGIFVSGSDVAILHNTLHDLRNGIDADWNPTDSRSMISGNNIYNVDGGVLESPQQSGGAIGPIYVSHNEIHDYANWDTTSDAFHHDGLHCFTSESTSRPAHYKGLYIYDNTFGGHTDTGLYGDADNMTAQIFLQGSGSTECADDSSPIYIFNNVLSGSFYVNDGLVDAASGVPYVLSNTMIGSGTSHGATYSSGDAAVDEVFQNNLTTTAHALMYITLSQTYDRPIFARGSPSHNLYANGGSTAFICRINYYHFWQFGMWRACIGGDAGSRVVASASLNTNGSPRRNSPAVAAGTNLSALCTGDRKPLCSDIRGRPRPATGFWSVGAYQ